MPIEAISTRSGGYPGLVQQIINSRKAAAEKTTEPPPTTTDRIEISETAKKLAEALQPLGNPKLVDRYGFPAELAAFRTELSNRFRVAGIDTSIPFDLKVDASGAVRVAGNHPDKARIEALLASDPSLANLAKEIAGTTSLMRALDENRQFANAYARDPQLAVVEYADLLSEAANDIGFRFTGDAPPAVGAVARAG